MAKRIIAFFIATFAAITISVFLFAPERLPSGVGITRVPVEVAQRSSRIRVGDVLVVTNTSKNPLYNVNVSCQSPEKDSNMTWFASELKPGASIELGWMQKWRIHPGDKIEISASGYRSMIWSIDEDEGDRL